MLLQPFLLSALGGLAYLSQGVSALPAEVPDLSLDSRANGFFEVTAPQQKTPFTFGSTLTVTWKKSSNVNGNFALTLVGGPKQGEQIELGRVAESVKHSEGQYSWTISETFVGQHAYYGLKAYSSEIQAIEYSPYFHISGGPASGGTDDDVKKGTKSSSG